MREVSKGNQDLKQYNPVKDWHITFYISPQEAIWHGAFEQIIHCIHAVDYFGESKLRVNSLSQNTSLCMGKTCDVLANLSALWLASDSWSRFEFSGNDDDEGEIATKES